MLQPLLIRALHFPDAEESRGRQSNLYFAACPSKVRMADTQYYCAYILRGWRESAGDHQHPVWRFRLRDAQTGEERPFASLEAATAFLQQALGGDAGRNVEDEP